MVELGCTNLNKFLQTNWSFENLNEGDESETMNVTFVSSMEEYNTKNITDLVNYETAAFLCHPESVVRCPLKVTISAEEGSHISALTVLSESRTAEVYVGKFEEYAFTIKAVQTFSMDDISVSVIAVRLERPTKTVHLKLSGLADPLRCMMFAVLVCQEPVHTPAPLPSIPKPVSSLSHFESLVDKKIEAFESSLVGHMDLKLAECSAVEDKVEALLDRKIGEFEARLSKFVDDRLEGIEQRIMERLEKVLGAVGNRCEEAVEENSG